MATESLRELRVAVVERAREQCEYCQKPDDQTLNLYRHEVDHIIAEKHGGKTELANLAYACFQCNRHKGSDIASIDPQSGEVVQLFNPRTQSWEGHFRLNSDGTISPLTPEGRTTVTLLRFNDPLRVQIRADLIVVGKLSPAGGQS